MKSSVLCALVAAVAAQENFACKSPYEGEEPEEVETTMKITDAATCKEAVDAFIVVSKAEEPRDPDAGSDGFTIADWCFHAAVQAEVAADAEADPPVTAVEASVLCQYVAD